VNGRLEITGFVWFT